MVSRDQTFLTKEHADRLARKGCSHGARFGWYQVTLIFFLWSIIGLVLEDVWMVFSSGVSQSRAGLVWGPFSPLYGTGAVLLTALLLRLHDQGATLWQVFLASMLMGGLLEQATGWAMETLFGVVSWNYIAGHVPGALSKWVALPFLFIWGGLGLLWYRMIMPGLLRAVGGPTSKPRTVFVGLIGLFLILDIFVTLTCFTRMAERDANIPPSNILEEWVDNSYNDEFVAQRFENFEDTDAG